MSEKFDGMSDEEIEAEIDRRQEQRRIKAIPQQVENPDFAKLRAYVHEGVMELAGKEHRTPKDFDHYVFEHVMQALYGPKIWEWWNKQHR